MCYGVHACVQLPFLDLLQAEKLKKKPVRFRATGETDYTFLAHLPQTLFYKVCYKAIITLSNICNQMHAMHIFGCNG